MSSEATVTSTLQIRKTSGTITTLEYQSRPATFLADVDGTKGPVPGALTVRTTGTVVDFSQLTIPGLCRIFNMDTASYFEYGIYDPQTHVFYPLGEVMPGESYVIRLSRNLLEEYSPGFSGLGTGTGTTAATNQFMLKAFSANCNAVVEAFEK